MLDLLKQLFNKVEGIKGKKLVIFLLSIFIIFILIGISIGYFTSGGLKESEDKSTSPVVKEEVTQKIYMEGKVIYVNPELYPGDLVSYKLVDSSGKDLILLKSKDQKLSIVEGLYVKVSGKMLKLKDNTTDVLMVDEVIIKNATN